MLQPDILYRARAPLRLSFAGGGSELPPYVHTHGGVVLNATIGRYVYATISRSADSNTVTFTAADCGISETLPAQTAYPLAGSDVKLPLHRAVYNRVIKLYGNNQPLPLTLHTYSDAPVGSGLGTSSTLTVAMLRCFDEALGIRLDEYALASLAHDIERSDLQLAGGYQDHYAAAFGGINFIEFHADGKVVVNPLRIRPAVLAELEYSIILYFTGISRASADIIDKQAHAIANQAEVKQAIHRIKALAMQMKDQLLTGDIAAVAATMHEGWLLKRATAAAISNDSIDKVYQQALANGALGGKISGAGGGGFMILLADTSRRQNIIDHLPNAATQASSCHLSHDGAVAWRTKK